MRAKIRFAYRIIIDHNSQSTWDKYVFEDTYNEYLMQHQKFNKTIPQATNFRSLLHTNPNAEQLHFLVELVISDYVNQLKGALYHVSDVLGNNYFPIDGYKLDIINTDIQDISKHKIGVTFYSKELILIDIINNCYLVSTEIDKINSFDTLMFPLQSKLSICYYEKID